MIRLLSLAKKIMILLSMNQKTKILNLKLHLTKEE